MALRFEKQTAKVAHLNVREEMHGEEPTLAADVKVVADIGNDFLDLLSPGLRSAMYAGEEQLEGVEAKMSVLRWPTLKPLDWDCPLEGAKFTLHGARKSDDLLFECQVKKPLVLACKEGGTVTVSLQVQITPDPAEMGALAAFLGRVTKVSLEPQAQPDTPPVE